MGRGDRRRSLKMSRARSRAKKKERQRRRIDEAKKKAPRGRRSKQ